MSQSCEIADCDAFFSHSWHDDAGLKWTALSDWCEDFRRAHGRAPRLWFNKVCIDQTNIAADLQYLPNLLAACNRLLILSGATYTDRLWCCVELFVYVIMQDQDESRGAPLIIALGATEGERVAVRDTWNIFNVQACHCSPQAD